MSPAALAVALAKAREEAQSDRLQPVGIQNLRSFLSIRQLERQRTGAHALFTQFQKGGLINPLIDPEDVKVGAGSSLKPVINGDMSPELRPTLAPAFALALERLRTVPECRSPSHQLRAQGPVMAATTIYMPDPASSSRACKRKGVATYTPPGNPTTYICDSFSSLPCRFAALSLVHEALHDAGLPERPLYPTAMSTWEINEVVHNRCRL